MMNISWYCFPQITRIYTDFLKELHKNNKSYELSFLYKHNHLGKSAKSVGNKFALKPKKILYKESGLKSAPIDINFEKYGKLPSSNFNLPTFQNFIL